MSFTKIIGGNTYFYDDLGRLIGVDDGKSSRKPTNEDLIKYGYSKPPTQSTPRKKNTSQTPTQTPTQQNPPSAVYVEAVGGVVTSDNKTFKTTNKKFIPKGYSQGFAEIRPLNNNQLSVTVIPKSMTQYAQNTKEGVTISRPIYNDKGMSYNSNESITLGDDKSGYVQIPYKKPKQSFIKETYKETGQVIQENYGKAKGIGYAFIEAYTRMPDDLGTQAFLLSHPEIMEEHLKNIDIASSYQERKFINLITGGTVIAGVSQIPVINTIVGGYFTYETSKNTFKGFTSGNPRRTAESIVNSPLTLISGYTTVKSLKSFKNIELPSTAKQSFYGVKSSVNGISVIDLFSVTRVKTIFWQNRYYAGFSKVLINEKNDLSIAKTGQLINRNGVKEVKEINSVGVVKELGKVKYVFGGVEKDIEGTGNIGVSFNKEVRGFKQIKFLDLFRSKISRMNENVKVNNKITKDIIGGVFRNVDENTFTFIGSTKPKLKIYNTGKRSYVLKDINVKGILRVGNAESEINNIGGLSTLKKFSKSNEQKVLNEVSKIGGSSIQQSKVNNVEVFKDLSTPKVSQSLYYGRGQYERTDTTSVLSMPSIQKQNSNFKMSTFSNELQRSDTFNIISTSQLNVNRSQSKSKLNYNIAQSPVSQSRLISQSATKQQQGQKLKLNTPQLFKQTNKSRVSLVKPTKIKTPIPTPSFNINTKSKSLLGSVFGYKTFYIKNNKKVFLSGVREKGSAIKYGEKYTLNTLRATFGVQKTKQKVKGMNTMYTPSRLYFRTYKINKGRKQELNDMFIQKKGTRLSSIGERKEIQSKRGFRL